MNSKSSFIPVLAGIILLVALAGCAGPGQRIQVPLSFLEIKGAGQGLDLHLIDTEIFRFAALVPQKNKGPVLRVYIEGDGMAWQSRTRLSRDPTPVKPVALNLMMRDTFLDKAYLARPCQYIQTEQCDPGYWSVDQFSHKVIRSMGSALDRLKESGNYTSLELVGFSGGGAVAAILAGGRSDVSTLITIAGNLDHKAFTRYHRVSPLSGSLNPPDFIHGLENLYQHHFIGEKDKVVPLMIFKSYAGFFKESVGPAFTLVEGVSHTQGWEAVWPELLMIAFPENLDFF